MIAVIVAGGRGERLKPLTDKRPKAMIQIAGKPILEHILNLCKSYGITEFAFSLCYLPQKIISYFGDGSKFGVKIDYVFEDENTSLGTAGAVLGAKKFIKDTFIVTYGDILRELDIRKMIAHHRKNKVVATITVYKNLSSNPKSVIKLDHNKVIKFTERPVNTTNNKKPIWSNASFYIFEPEIFDFIPSSVKSDFGHDIFPKLLVNKKKISSFICKDYFVDIGDRGKLSYARKTFNPIF